MSTETTESTEMVVTVEGLDELIGLLRAEGRIVIGPTVRDGAISHDQIDRIADLPRGWSEDQAPGSYRLQATGTDELFAFSTPAESWKRFVFPPRTLLIRGRREPKGIEVEEPELDEQPVALFGIRSCDLAGLSRLDAVFMGAPAPDPHYAARRAGVFVVAVGCSNPAQTCFCTSMGTGPSPSRDFDLAVRELVDDTTIDYLVEAGSGAGAAMLARLRGRSVTEADHEQAVRQHDAAVAAIERMIDPADPPLAAVDPDDPRWTTVAERCLACGNCTMVCPTCFCSTTEDSSSLDGQMTERTRVWDSCFTIDFTHMHGGATRTSIASRYRQWLLHKLVTWHDQFDTSGCVGCGRCITWCPVGIDLTVEVAALADAQRAPS